MDHFLAFLLVGFCAQLVDGALGMAYGLTSNSLLLSLGLPPAIASATTHAAECFTTGFSGVAHHQFGNVDRSLFRSLVLPGMAGAIVGAYLLAGLHPETIKPIVGFYLLGMGLLILVKAFRAIPTKKMSHPLIPLGFIGAFLDAVGGGGWGALVTSTLLARGNDVRKTVGSVNASQFFVAVSASVTFFWAGTNISWQVVLALALGGALAAPLGAWLCKYLPTKGLLVAVGLLIISLSCRTIWLSLK
jgi:uncharacterized membrane protein YfcA